MKFLSLKIDTKKSYFPGQYFKCFLVVIIIANYACGGLRAETFLVDGKRLTDTISEPPLLPSKESCEQYRNDVGVQIQELEHAHDQCLSDHGSDTGSNDRTYVSADGSKIELCSHSQCQSLHTARIDVRKQLSEKMRECNANAAQREKMLEPVLGSKNRNDSSDDKGATEEQQNLGEKAARLAISKLKKGIAKTGALTTLDMSMLTSECDDLSAVQAQKVCLARVRTYMKDMQGQLSSDPTVRVIRKASASELKRQQNESIDRMSEVSNAVKDLESDGDQPKSKRTREYRAPVIENE